MNEGEEMVREFCQLLQAAIGNNQFLVGALPTYSDFCVNWGLRLMMLYSSSTVKKFPTVVAYHNSYLNLPGIDAGTQAQAERLDMPPVGWQADNMPKNN